MQHFWVGFLASLLAAGVTTAGILVIRHFGDWGVRNSTYFACFASGVLISVSFLHIAPTSFEMTPLAPAALLAGYFMLYAANRFLTTQVCERPVTADYAIGLLPMIGIGLHSFIDGAIYSITFSVNLFTGIAAAIGMVLHEFPEGIITYVLLLRGGFRERTALSLAFVAAALTTPLGMLVSFPIVSQINDGTLGVLLALSAGALIYVGATHLLPQAEREPRRYNFLAVALGALVAIGIVVSKG